MAGGVYHRAKLFFARDGIAASTRNTLVHLLSLRRNHIRSLLQTTYISSPDSAYPKLLGMSEETGGHLFTPAIDMAA
jgi:hypothetical protein